MPTNEVWHAQPLEWNVQRDEVHVWRINLDEPPICDVYKLWSLLSADEVDRAWRFRFVRDRERFAVARGTLRALIGQYVGRDPRALGFRYNPHGKPFLEQVEGKPVLSFNMSHAGSLALLAVSQSYIVGVDIEVIRDDLDIEQIAEHCFSPSERADLRRLQGAQKTEGFFNAWTRKETYIKARGEGLSLALDAFDVTLIPGEPAALCETRDQPEHSHQWMLRELSPGPGYAGAVAVAGTDWRLICWHWGVMPQTIKDGETWWGGMCQGL